MSQLIELRSFLAQAATTSTTKNSVFFKTGTGSYAEHDQFIGVSVPVLRTLAKEFSTLSLQDIKNLLSSPINEERLLALFILVARYQKGNDETKEQLFNFYLANIKAVNNWNLVDSSAHLIIGAHLYGKDTSLLRQLAQSKNMWERRIAIVATWYFIRQKDVAWTYTIAKQLLNDQEDLIHKAVGWMLREAGERDLPLLTNFLELHAATMPRTMLRYAIEKYPENERKAYLAIKQLKKS